MEEDEGIGRAVYAMRMRYKARKVYEDFAKDLDAVKIERVKMGVDQGNKMLSDVRITRAMREHPSYKKMMDDVIRLPRRKDLD